MSVEDSQSTIGEWNKMLKHTPTGTRGMMAPEVQNFHYWFIIIIVLLYIQLFFVTDRGVHFNSHKSDVYSACATMMEVLVGKIVNAEPHKQVTKHYISLIHNYIAYMFTSRLLNLFRL